MARFGLIPVQPGSQSEFQLTTLLPPPVQAPMSTGACACSDLAAVWFTGETTATMVEDDAVPAAFSVSGTICAGTTYELATSWTADAGGYEPNIVAFGQAWAVYATDPGVLEITITATCGGDTFVLAPITLTVMAAAYSGCVAPTEYQNLLTLAFNGCIEITYAGTGSELYNALFPDSETGTWYQDTNHPFYDNLTGVPGEGAGALIHFSGLRDLFGSSDMMVQVQIIDHASLGDGPYGWYVDTHFFETVDDMDALGANLWEYTVANADIDTFSTGFGSGDGAGASGGVLEVRIKVKVAS